MRCAVVEISTNLVVNFIIADPVVDNHLDGFILIGIHDEDPVGIGWSWNGTYFNPPIPSE